MTFWTNLTFLTHCASLRKNNNSRTWALWVRRENIWPCLWWLFVKLSFYFRSFAFKRSRALFFLCCCCTFYIIFFSFVKWNIFILFLFFYTLFFLASSTLKISNSHMGLRKFFRISNLENYSQIFTILQFSRARIEKKNRQMASERVLLVLRL